MWAGLLLLESPLPWYRCITTTFGCKYSLWYLVHYLPLSAACSPWFWWSFWALPWWPVVTATWCCLRRWDRLSEDPWQVRDDSPGGCCSVGYSSEFDIKLKSREILFLRNVSLSCPIVTFRMWLLRVCWVLWKGRILMRMWQVKGLVGPLQWRLNIGGSPASTANLWFVSYTTWMNRLRPELICFHSKNVDDTSIEKYVGISFQLTWRIFRTQHQRN